MLTEQNKVFVEKFIELKCKSQTQAAILAGYSPRSAASQATELLKKPEIQEYLRERKMALLKEIQEKIVFNALEAVDVIYDIMTDCEAKNTERLNAARDILDRAGINADVYAAKKDEDNEQTTGIIGLNSVDVSTYEKEKARELERLKRDEKE